MRINIQSDLTRLSRNLTDLEKRQIPFAASYAINRVVKDLREWMIAQTPAYLDRPTPFTLRGFRYKKSDKHTLTGSVYIEDTRSKYLDLQIEGGLRIPFKKAIKVPASTARLNRYGNLPRGRISSMLNNKHRYFSGTPKGGNRPAGIWERKNRNTKIVPIVYWSSKAVYGKRFPFYKIGGDYVQDHWRREMRNAINIALSTMRRRSY